MMFDEEEAISTKDDYSGVSPPVMGTEDMGVPEEPAIDTGEGTPALPGTAPPPGAGPQNAMNPIMAAGKELLTDPGAAIKKYPGNFKSIISYLMGSDAMPPEAIDGAGRTVDPEGRMNPSERNLMALQHARENGGDDAAWALMQANRVAYNAQTAFAKTALEGTAQKPADIMAAVDAANKAQTNVLDGSHVEFRPANGGRMITATVTTPGGQPDQITLDPQQFARWLDVGGDGQWDKIMSTGAAEALRKIAGPGTRGSTSLADMPPAPRSTRPDAPGNQPPEAPPIDNSESDAYDPLSEENAPKSNFGKTPSTLNLSGSDARSEPAPDKTNYSPELRARADAMFPGITQQGEAERWMAQQSGVQDERQTRVDVAKEGRLGKLEAAQVAARGRVEQEGVKQAGAKDVAGIRANGYAIRDQNKAKIEADKLAMRARELISRDARSAQGLAMKAISSKIGAFQTLTPQEEELAKRFGVLGLEATEATRPAAHQQQAPQGAPKAPPAAGAAPKASTNSSRQVGQTVTTAKGTFEWTGTGWKPK